MTTNRWFGMTLAGLLSAASVGIAQAAGPTSQRGMSSQENARQVELSAFEARQERARQYHFKQPGDIGYIQRSEWDGGVLPKAPRMANPATTNLTPSEFSAFEARQDRARQYHFKQPGDIGYIQREEWDGGVLPKRTAMAPNPMKNATPAEFSAFELRQERAKQYHFKKPGDIGYIQRDVWD